MDKPKQNSENTNDPAITEILTQYDEAVASDNFIAQGESLLHLGTLYAIRSQYATAIEYYSQALSIQRDINDEQGQSKSLSNMGLAYADLGNYHKAIKHHLKALNISQGLNDRVTQSNHLNNLAETYELLENYDKAIAYLDQVQDLYQTMAVPHLLKKAQQYMDKLRQIKLESTLAQQQDPIESSRQPTVIKALHNKRASSETQAITGETLNDSDDEPQIVKDIMNKLPNPALRVVEELTKSDKVKRRTSDNTIKEALNELILSAQVENLEPLEAEDTAIFSSVEDDETFEAEDTAITASVEEEEDKLITESEHPNQEDKIRESIVENTYELSIAEAIGELSKKGDYLMRLGALYMRLKQYDDAIVHYEEAMVLFEGLGQDYFREEAERGITEAQEKKQSNY